MEGAARNSYADFCERQVLAPIDGRSLARYKVRLAARNAGEMLRATPEGDPKDVPARQEGEMESTKSGPIQPPRSR